MASGVLAQARFKEISMSQESSHTVFLRYRQELLAWLTQQMQEADQARDVVQELYLRYVDHAAAHPVENPRAYLFQMARNILVDMARQQQSRQTDAFTHEEMDAIGMVDPNPGPEQIAAGKQRLRLLVACLAELPELTQQIFILNRVHEMSYREVAEQLGISVSSVQKHLAKALRHVMDHMKTH